ncbi:hypothetical protein ACU6YF_11480 [Klebsiella aerogenes]|uniref:hypothetical protein n=1 Tax=Klebsiella aerogenes TaxID=548 RepID=UPI00292CB45E|nr:hypothetical protein [Klebsiella aerogenes]
MENNDNSNTEKEESTVLTGYEQEIMAKVPFGDLGVATESHHNPYREPSKSKND